MSQNLASFNVLRIILRNWRAKLSHDEFQVILFVWDRTYAYRKEVETIPIRHMLNGVWSYAGELLHCPIPLRERQIYRALKSLKEKSLLLARKNGRGNCTRYAINPQMVLYDLSYKTGTTCHTRQVEPVIQDRSIYNNYGYTNMKNLTGAGGSGVGSKIREIAEKAAEKSAIARERKKNKSGVLAYYTVWTDIVKYYYPKSVISAWTIKQSKIIQAVLIQPLGTPKEVRTFFDVICGNWGQIMRSEFKWYTSTPEIPDIVFMCRFAGKFFSVYATFSGDGAAPIRGESQRLTGEGRKGFKRPDNAGVLAEIRAMRGMLDKTTAELAEYKRKTRELLADDVRKVRKFPRVNVKRLGFKEYD